MKQEKIVEKDRWKGCQEEEAQMNERQRWRPEEDAILRAYVRQYGPREWAQVSQRMNSALNRDAKSCLERWKNYLKPGIKKGSLTEEEQRHVIRLQAKHGNKWKRIAAEVPGRTAKRLGKWWEVFKEKRQREIQVASKPSAVLSSSERGKYDVILQSFAEKLVKERRQVVMAAAPPAMLPCWVSSSGGSTPPSPSVTLSLAPPMPWRLISDDVAAAAAASQMAECCRVLEEGRCAWMEHRKEAAWRLKRVELQLESEKACKRKEKMEEFEAKMRALREEQSIALERIEAQYRDQILGLRKEADAKEQKMAEQWAAKHSRLGRLLGDV